MPLKIKNIENDGGGIISCNFEIKIAKDGVKHTEIFKKGLKIEKAIEDENKIKR